MKNSIVSLITLLLSSVMLTSCEVIGDIFGAGVYTGIFLVVVVVALLIFIVGKVRKRN